jgi:hypothetical protein
MILGDTTACVSAADSFATSLLPALSPPAVFNTWQVTGVGISINASNQNRFHYIHGNGPVETVVLTTSDHGCVGHDTMQVVIYPRPVPPIPLQPAICTGDSVLLDAGPGFATYAWSTGSSLSSIFANNSSPYTISVTDALHNCLGTATSFPIVVTDCVWPGDANHDYIVDLNDFLAIGVAFGDTGSARQNAVNTWLGQPATDWSSWFLSGENFKHADSDGNGLVDFPDTVCVSLHQGFTHVRTGTIAGGVPLLISPRITPFAGQDSVELIVTLGDSMFQTDSAYGLTFHLNYAGGDVYAGVGGRVSNSFLGASNQRLMHLSDEDANGGRFGWAMVRTDHQPKSGFGEVCRIRLKVRPSVWAGQVMVAFPMSVSHCRLIDKNGVDIPLTVHLDTLWLYDLGYVSNAAQTNVPTFHVSPNPTGDFLHLRIENQMIGRLTVSMIDANGVEVLREMYSSFSDPTLKDIDINVQHLPVGMYAFRVTSARNTTVARIAVVR